jgi:hypothetical protein
VAAVLSTIPIIHLHGSLGPLPWQHRHGRDYDVEIDTRLLKVATDSLKIIHEDITDGRDADFRRAKELLSQAEQIRFMGFGYNRINMERLGLANLPRGIAMGTTQGIGNSELRSIATAVDDRIHFFPADCLEMVREQLPLQ